jgi:hypothetical protein
MKVVSIGSIANDEINYDMWLELPYSQPSMRLEQTRREGGDPVVTRARREPFGLDLNIRILADTEAEARTLREALLAALDTETAAIALVVEDDDGSHERFRYVMVGAVDEQRPARGAGQQFLATLVTHGEARWRANAPASTTWNVTASGETTVIANNGTLPARPVYTIQPTVSNTTEFAYRRFCSVKWHGRAATFYPVDITAGQFDTAALITAGKISGENNIAIAVNGVRRKRWFVDYNTDHTRVWVNLDWIYCPPAYLRTGFGAGDTVTEIVSAVPINRFPFQGMFQIGAEIFTYSGKRDKDNTFTGVTRAAKGTEAQAATGGVDEAGDAVELLQHDIWILYGGGGDFINQDDTSGPSEVGAGGADTFKPMMDLAGSTNQLWRFDHFGQAGEEYRHRAMSWRPSRYSSGTSVDGDPFDLLILYSSDRRMDYLWWSIPMAHRLNMGRVIGRIQANASETWEAGLRTATADGVVVDYLSISTTNAEGAGDFDIWAYDDSWWADTLRFYLRVDGSATLYLDMAILFWLDYPISTVGGEETLYDLFLTLENVTTGQSITLDLPMRLNEQLEVDTAEHAVTLLNDGSSQYQALARSTRRREILALIPGNNTLRVTEDGLDGVTVYIEFEERSYS